MPGSIFFDQVGSGKVEFPLMLPNAILRQIKLKSKGKISSIIPSPYFIKYSLETSSFLLFTKALI